MVSVHEVLFSACFFCIVFILERIAFCIAAYRGFNSLCTVWSQLPLDAEREEIDIDPSLHDADNAIEE
jgi:hypothetical protein